jgi:YidC/Oxa1 family membrane protein insertase
MPTWVKVAIDAWANAVGITDGPVFRSVNSYAGIARSPGFGPRGSGRQTWPGSPASAAAKTSGLPKDYGYIVPLARPFEWTLREVEARAMYRAGRSSWGWDIMLTTILVNLILLPFRILAARAKIMKALQPQIDAINARYIRKGLNTNSEYSREISEVYKQHRTSQLAGCIPALAPVAVLVAFYSVLTGIPELHGAPWLWIRDLSKPEQLLVRILPVLMFATQLLVAKITPAPDSTDRRTTSLMTLMPLVFVIALYQQPSALMFGLPPTPADRAAVVARQTLCLNVTRATTAVQAQTQCRRECGPRGQFTPLV